MIEESAPSTVIYRKEGTRTSLQQLIDSVATNGGSSRDLGQADAQGGSGAGARGQGSPTGSGKVAPPVDVSKPPPPAAAKLGWVQGVFIPCLLNIWGVIMFLRLGWVVGQAGVFMASLIVFCSKLVTTVTALSLCAITTNGEVKGGGVYFLISRALGPVFGGTIGILFFVAQAVATSMYVIGFAESIVFLMADSGVEPFTGSDLNDIRIIGLATTVLLLGVALIGVSWYAKCQVGLLVILVVAMLSVVIGSGFPNVPDLLSNAQAGFVGLDWRNAVPSYVRDPSTPGVEQTFFTVFAVFFPAATGVMAGANLSGDLKDPSSAIPKGTLGAIAVTFVSYIALVFFVGTACLVCSNGLGDEISCDDMKEAYKDPIRAPSGGLLFNKLIMQNMAIWSPLLYLGVFAATLSSALASLVGAPRILQSVASDELFPWAWFNYFGEGRGPSNEPVRAYMLTFVICCGCVAIGKLDVIAPLISNFFMLSYAFTNYACFASSMARYPGWRPSFRYYNKWLSLFGFVLCIVVMFLMDWVTSIVTIILACGLYGYLWNLDPAVDWGPAGTARLYFSTLKGLERLQSLSTDHVKTYRPQFLVMCGQPQARPHLIKFTSLLSKGGGITLCGDVVLDANVGNNMNDSTIGRVVNRKGEVTLEGISEEEFGETDDDVAHSELAAKLAQRLTAVSERRAAGDDFLANKRVWGGKRCPQAFFEAVVGDTLLQGFESLLQTAGVGKMRSNVVVLGFKSDWNSADNTKTKEWETMIRISLASNQGLVILRDDASRFDLEMPSKRRFNSVASATGSSAVDEKSKETGRITAAATLPTDSHCTSPTPLGADAEEVRVDVGNGSDVIRRTNSQFDLPGEFLDVWWIADDGGLTILLPFLLSQHRIMRGNKTLRVFTVTNYSEDETSRLQKTEFRMIHLLQKLRIKAKVIGVEANLASDPKPAIVEEFEGLGAVSQDSLTADEKAKTNRMLRLSELLREHTDESTATTFMTLPLPDTGMPVKLFTSWLHMMSDGQAAPVVFIRGSGEQVVTFVC